MVKKLKIDCESLRILLSILKKKLQENKEKNLDIFSLNFNTKSNFFFQKMTFLFHFSVVLEKVLEDIAEILQNVKSLKCFKLWLS